MAAQTYLIMNVLRLITPEEIGDIATKHNGGKFLSLTDLVTERVEQKIYRDFTSPDSIDEIHQAHNGQAKILPFKKNNETITAKQSSENESADEHASLAQMASQDLESAPQEVEETAGPVEHSEEENMSTFILIEKARLKRSQKILKQKEIIDLYQKNSSVDVEQIKNSNSNISQSRESGILVNKKQY